MKKVIKLSQIKKNIGKNVMIYLVFTNILLDAYIYDSTYIPFFTLCLMFGFLNEFSESLIIYYKGITRSCAQIRVSFPCFGFINGLIMLFIIEHISIHTQFTYFTN
jgi:hypothetical protein